MTASASLVLSVRASAQGVALPPLAGPGTIVGVVTDAERRPVEDAEVRIGKLDRSTRTGRNGMFRFDSIADGKHELRVRRLGYEPQSRTVTVREAGGSVVFSLKAAPHRLAPVVTSISRGGLGGFVLDSSSRPVQGAVVSVFGGTARTVTDSAGEFFVDVRPGTFMVRVTSKGFASRLVSVTVPNDSGRQIVIGLVPGKGSSAREEIEMDNLRRRLVWRVSPAAVFGREKLDALPNKRLEALVRAVNPNPLTDECLALVDGGPEAVPLWYLDVDDLEAVEVYPRGTLSYVTANRRQGATMGGRDMPPDQSYEELLRAGAARTCPAIFVWLR
jgi:hypothetical protein